MCAPAQAFPHFSFLPVCLSSPSPPPSRLLAMRALYRIHIEARSAPPSNPLPTPQCLSDFSGCMLKNLRELKQEPSSKVLYLFSTRNLEETQKPQGLVMADMSGQAWALPGGLSASGGFLAKLLLAWVPLERRLRGSVLLSLFNNGAQEPFQACLFWQRAATSDRAEWAACPLRLEPGRPHRENRQASGSGRLVLLVACPGRIH